MGISIDLINYAGRGAGIMPDNFEHNDNYNFGIMLAF